MTRKIKFAVMFLTLTIAALPANRGFSRSIAGCSYIGRRERGFGFSPCRCVEIGRDTNNRGRWHYNE